MREPLAHKERSAQHPLLAGDGCGLYLIWGLIYLFALLLEQHNLGLMSRILNPILLGSLTCYYLAFMKYMSMHLALYNDS